MVHHHIEIKEIEQWQIIFSLVHSTLVVHCRYRLNFFDVKGQQKDSFISDCCLLTIVVLDHVQSP